MRIFIPNFLAISLLVLLLLRRLTIVIQTDVLAAVPSEGKRSRGHSPLEGIGEYRNFQNNSAFGGRMNTRTARALLANPPSGAARRRADRPVGAGHIAE